MTHGLSENHFPLTKTYSSAVLRFRFSDFTGGPLKRVSPYTVPSCPRTPHHLTLGLDLSKAHTEVVYPFTCPSRPASVAGVSERVGVKDTKTLSPRCDKKRQPGLEREGPLNRLDGDRTTDLHVSSPRTVAKCPSVTEKEHDERRARVRGGDVQGSLGRKRPSPFPSPGPTSLIYPRRGRFRRDDPGTCWDSRTGTSGVGADPCVPTPTTRQSFRHGPRSVPD